MAGRGPEFSDHPQKTFDPVTNIDEHQKRLKNFTKLILVKMAPPSTAFGDFHLTQSPT